MAETGARHQGRNEPCHCGSGKKYKHCCLVKDEEADRVSREHEASAAQPTKPPAEEPPQRTPPPPRTQGQPWKRTSRAGPGARRVTTPRKTG
ncbi:MAG: SEC-C domain-containing protein [Acidobacteriia bacterium]|nr:SEC-C domain-containing protein [Terriglobia bacterium]